MKKRVVITLIIWITVFQTHVWCASNKRVLVIGNSDYKEVPWRSISLQRDVHYISKVGGHSQQLDSNKLQERLKILRAKIEDQKAQRAKKLAELQQKIQAINQELKKAEEAQEKTRRDDTPDPLIKATYIAIVRKRQELSDMKAKLEEELRQEIALYDQRIQQLESEYAEILYPPTTDNLYYFSIEVKEQVNPLDYYPLHVGNTWIYHHVYKTVIGQSAKFITITWESEESVIAHYDLPEGKVIIRRIMNRNIEYAYPEDIEEEALQEFLEIEKIEEEYNRYYLVKGNYIYGLSNRYWNDDKKTLTEEFRKRTKGDFGTPVFFFPMEKVHVWSNRAQEQEDYMKGELWKQGKGPAPNPVMYYWHVENPIDVEVPFGIVKQTIPLIYQQLCGPERIWFKKEIGIIKERFDHQGTYIEREKVLKDFLPHKNNE